MVVESSVAKSEIAECMNKINTTVKYVYFRDITKNDWFAKYICIAKNKGVISGYPDKTFKPNNNITFAEAAKIIVTTFGYIIENNVLWFKPYVEVLDSKNAIPSSLYGCNQWINR